MRKIFAFFWPLLAQAPGVAQAPTAREFARIAFDSLPIEQPYEYHQKLKNGPIHEFRRDTSRQASSEELTIPDQGWGLMVQGDSGQVLRHAVDDFQNYLKVSMKVDVSLKQEALLQGWNRWQQRIVVGTRQQLGGCGKDLKAAKDYQLMISSDRIVVCGYDERGAAYGLYNLEARMNLREGPYLPNDLDVTRHSLYQTRMVLNWLGWMEWSDNYLAHLAHDGFDAIYASVYANPNGAEGTAHYVLARKQDPAAMRDLVRRAGGFGIKVYTPLLYRYTGEPENQQGLRKLVRDILTEIPGIPRVHPADGRIFLRPLVWRRRPWQAGPPGVGAQLESSGGYGCRRVPPDRP